MFQSSFIASSLGYFKLELVQGICCFEGAINEPFVYSNILGEGKQARCITLGVCAWDVTH